MIQVPAGHPEKPQGEDGVKLLERMNGGTHEELAEWGLSFLPVSDADSILDIGCGGGANIARLLDRAPRGTVAGVDYSPMSVEVSAQHNVQAIAQGRCKVLEGDASHLPFPDDEFNLVTAFETTYYWDLPTAFPEVLRVLKPGGSFLVCNEDDGLNEERLDLASRIPGMVMHTSEQLVSALEGAGFAVDRRESVPEKGHLALVARKPARA